jgi:hypothetical protein
MDIRLWQDKFVSACKKKFPKEFSPEQRLLAVSRQLADVSERMQFNPSDLKYRIAAILPDIFMLCDQCDVDLNKELVGVLGWFESDVPKEMR